MSDRYRRDERRGGYNRDYYESRGYDRSSRGYYGQYEDEYNDRGYRDDYRPERRYSDYRGASRTSGRGNNYYRRTDRESDFSRAFRHTGEERGVGKKIVIVLIIFAFIIGNFIVFSVLDSIGKNDKKVQTSSSDTDNVFIQDEDFSQTDITRTQAQILLSQMSTEEKVGQLFLIRSYGRSIDDFSALISQCKVGGIVLFKSDFEGKSKQEVRNMTAAFQSAGNGKLLVCVDEEGGTVVRMSSLSELRGEKYRSPQELYKIGGFEEIRTDTVNKCEFLRSYGVNVNFAPVADVVNEPSAFMYKRAFGKNAEATAEYVKIVVSAMKENNVGSSIKHFPGYGNSKGDTHEGLDHNKLSLASLKASDLVPFVSGVEAGADSIMVTHTIIDEVDAENPASLSTECVSIIRDYLDFDGVIMTDALDMGAIIEFCDGEDPCVQAFSAGIDMLCLPSDPAKAYDNMLSAVNDGRISMERLDESVVRILQWKINIGLYSD